MKTKPTLLALAFCAAVVSSATPAATFEAGLLAHYMWTGDDREHVQEGFGPGLDGLRLWNGHEGISLRVSDSVLKSDALVNFNREHDFQRYTATVGYWRYLDGDGFEISGFRPYVNPAIGFGRTETFRSEFEDDSGLLIELAAGVVSKWDVVIPGLKFRSEVRADWEDSYGGASDVQLGLGVHYTFGEAQPAPAPKAKPAPAPVEPPKPAPAPVAPPPPPKDSDGDGVPDDSDACPGTIRGSKVDARGCVVLEKMSLKGVTFASSSASLTGDSAAILNGVAASLRANSKLRIEVSGYTDTSGSAAGNLTLSQRRAESVKNYLLSQGVDGSQVEAKGYGGADPIDTNETPEGRANNRRVQVKVL